MRSPAAMLGSGVMSSLFPHYGPSLQHPQGSGVEIQVITVSECPLAFRSGNLRVSQIPIARACRACLGPMSEIAS